MCSGLCSRITVKQDSVPIVKKEIIRKSNRNHSTQGRLKRHLALPGDENSRVQRNLCVGHIRVNLGD